MDKAELISKLKRIDEDVFFSGILREGQRVGIIIVGASALLLNDLSSKGATKDVDVLRAEESVKPFLFSDADFNNQCAAYEACLPYNFEDRIERIDLDTYALDIYVPSLEDIAVMKLYRWEAPDVADLTAPEFLEKLDWAALDHLVHSPEEAAASRCALPEQDRELKNLLHNYRTYEEGWRP
ncbi:MULTISPECIES: DUF6036 family nucleotidyltransferase [unclassified Adlercreutzia]|uniref:DUF6036 family nucleotidyltransferase n=1 Tax=unclassified Adlercreutzia TaxID=2636013 RepID=UPI0013ECB4FE|nr:MULTISPECIES: DUF6036 family nucleotidyltransferase [unclassified Adlercreutzia]